MLLESDPESFQVMDLFLFRRKDSSRKSIPVFLFSSLTLSPKKNRDVRQRQMRHGRPELCQNGQKS